jgi:hypothetical protein
MMVAMMVAGAVLMRVPVVRRCAPRRRTSIVCAGIGRSSLLRLRKNCWCSKQQQNASNWSHGQAPNRLSTEAY